MCILTVVRKLLGDDTRLYPAVLYLMSWVKGDVCQRLIRYRAKLIRMTWGLL